VRLATVTHADLQQIQGARVVRLAACVIFTTTCNFSERVTLRGRFSAAMSLNHNRGGYMKQSIRTGTFVFHAMSFAVRLALLVLPMEASRAADDCLAKPNAPAPDGSHWYYRIDRMTQRQCWYLGPAGRQVREHAAQDASPVRSRSLKPGTQPRPAPQMPAQAPAVIATAEAGQPVPLGTTVDQAKPPPDAPTMTTIAAAQPESAQALRVGTTLDQAKTPADDPAATSSAARWSNIPTPTPLVEVEALSDSTRTADAEGATATKSEDEARPIWRALTRAEFWTAEGSPQVAALVAELSFVIAVAFGLAAILGRMISRISAARKPGRSRSGHETSLAANTHRVAEPTPPVSPTPAATHSKSGITGTPDAPSCAPSDPVVDVERTVLRLLQELERRRLTSSPELSL
jgi:hypothetical protein